jgi:hypothetical protein
MAREQERPERDRKLEAAEEEAEGIGGYRPPKRRALLEREREEAEGTEVFEDPDATLPRTDLREGPPDREGLEHDIDDEDDRDVADDA